jgi:exoribonuclease R
MNHQSLQYSDRSKPRPLTSPRPHHNTLPLPPKTTNSSGQVINARLLLTLVPPITRIRYDEANELLAQAPEAAPRHRTQAAQDLHAIRAIAETRRGLTQRDFSEGRRVARVKRNAATGQLEAVRFERTAAHLMVDELLALYSEAGRRFLKAHSATLPLAPGSVSGGMDAARFGTGPLRRYTDVLAQRQMSAVLKGQPPLPKAEIIRRMTQVNFQAKASRQLRAQSRTTVLFESFASFCAAQARAAHAPHATVKATATGTGTEVVLPEVGLRTHVRLPADWKKAQREGQQRRQKLFDLEAGREFDVNVLRVDPKKGVIDLEFADPARDAVGVEYEEEEDEEW